MGATIVAHTPFNCLSSCGGHNTADDQGPRDASSVAILSQQPGNSGTAIKSEDTGKNATVAVPELQRIQELHRVILTGVDVFAQVRFPNLHLCSGDRPPPFPTTSPFPYPNRMRLGGRGQIKMLE